MHSTGSREARKSTLTALHTNTRDGRGTDLDRSGSNRRVVPSTLDALNNNNLQPLGGGFEPPQNDKSKESSSRIATDDTPRLKVVNSPERGPVELLENSERSTIVYTDASVKNGLGGIGVFFGDHNRHNISERLHGSHDSSGYCEIIAAQKALQSCADRKIRGPIVLRTDCLQIVESMQKPQMLTLSPHSSQMVKLHDMAMNYPGGVQFEHVYAHMGNYGNERADQLATSATNRDRRPSPSRSRSKPPSKRMQRRTRKAFISRRTKSSPVQTPKITPKHAHGKSVRPAGLSQRRSLVTDATQRSRSTRSTLQSQSSSIAQVSVPSVVTARERRQATVLRSENPKKCGFKAKYDFNVDTAE
uniref:ribonuclease H n=1 Tax=Panagrellus redivivus TaxID=6233 RepID=A0A7E4VYB7_PANRE